ncbi:MAG: sterol desaturase family protein, partial [Bacteroidota bacterium]
EATKFQPKNSGKKEIFNNPLLEKLTRTHISIPLIIFYGISAYLLYLGFAQTALSAVTIIGVFVFGFLLFTWIEYNVHKHVFHMLPTTKLREDIQYKFHGVHHEYPKDKARLAMPPVVSITITIALFYTFKFAIGDYVFAFLPGFLSGYASYLAVHYIVHAFRPPKNIFKVLWVHHGIHHYKENDRAFGVSSPLWDYIYRTMPRG